MATPNGEYRSARKTPNKSRVIVSQYIAEPELPKRSGAGAGGPNTGERGFAKLSSIKLQPLVVHSDKLVSVAKTSSMQKQNTWALLCPFGDRKTCASEAVITPGCAHCLEVI